MDIESTLLIYTLCVCYMYDVISSLQAHGELGLLFPLYRWTKAQEKLTSLTQSQAASKQWSPDLGFQLLASHLSTHPFIHPSPAPSRLRVEPQHSI